MHGQPVGECFDNFHRDAKNPKLRSWKVSRTGDTVVMECDTVGRGKEGNIGNRYLVDLSKGCNLTCFDAVWPGGTERCQIQYVKNTDVWVPETATFETPRMKVELKWEESTVNSPVSEKEFELAAIGGRTGDVIVDKRTGLRETIGGDSAPAPNAASGRYVIAANGVIGVLVIGFVLYRRGRIRQFFGGKL